MNKRKFLLIVVPLLVLGIGLMVLRSLTGGDDIKPRLESIIYNSEVITELGSEAADEAGVYELQVKAASSATVAASDAQQLKAYYMKRYGRDIRKAPKPDPNTDPIAKLEQSQPGSSFDSTYQALVVQLLETNIGNLKTIHNQSENAELRALLESVFANQQTALEQLKQG